MNATDKTSDYILLFRGGDWYQNLSPAQMQTVGDQWMAWFERLKAQNKALSGNPLKPEGKVVSGKNGCLVVDGPFAESKEIVGGYFLLRVSGFDEALAIARECPGLPHGAKVEVRAVAEKCPMLEGMRDERELVHAAK
jgi:hypothetical protein